MTHRFVNKISVELYRNYYKMKASRGRKKEIKKML
jgi:hypothetical protein